MCQDSWPLGDYQSVQVLRYRREDIKHYSPSPHTEQEDWEGF